MRRPMVAGNWKMYKTPAEATELAERLVYLLGSEEEVDVVLCPPFPALVAVGERLAGTRLALGAQDVHWEEEGPFTGEVSPPMLRGAGCRYVIVGHSERRRLFGEDDGAVNRKVKAALDWDLAPIACVGETLAERDTGRTEAVVERQLLVALEGLSPAHVVSVVVAYEPVWAIGTGRPATVAEAGRVSLFLRRVLAQAYGPDAAGQVRILYGGSVKPDNMASFWEVDGIDGALVGGASLDPDAFAAIVRSRPGRNRGEEERSSPGQGH